MPWPLMPLVREATWLLGGRPAEDLSLKKPQGPPSNPLGTLQTLLDGANTQKPACLLAPKAWRAGEGWILDSQRVQ
jgi:hypothetical protein